MEHEELEGLLGFNNRMNKITESFCEDLSKRNKQVGRLYPIAYTGSIESPLVDCKIFCTTEREEGKLVHFFQADMVLPFGTSLHEDILAPQHFSVLIGKHGEIHKESIRSSLLNLIEIYSRSRIIASDFIRIKTIGDGEYHLESKFHLGEYLGAGGLIKESYATICVQHSPNYDALDIKKVFEWNEKAAHEANILWQQEAKKFFDLLC